MESADSLVGLLGYAVGAAAFFALLVPLVIAWRGRLQSGLLIVACAGTVLWAGMAARAYATGAAPGRPAEAFEILRTVAWLAFLWSALEPAAGQGRWPWRAPIVLASAGALLAAVLALVLLGGRSAAPGTIQPALYAHLLLAVVGLVLTETLFRNTPAEERWGVKFLCLATGGLFVYDLFFYANAILFRGLSPTFQEARGAIQALVVPLLAVSAVRSRIWHADIHVSRQVAVHSTALVAGGAYLVLMAALGFYLRRMGGTWGPAIQAIYLFGAVILLAVVLFSGAFRARLKVFISRHFYSHKYDYREEWLRFIHTVAADHDSAPLEERVIKAVARIVESPGGALWLREEGRYVPVASWNVTPPEVEVAAHGSLARFLGRRQWVVDIHEARSKPEKYGSLELPRPLAEWKRAWLIVPLWHHTLIGFLVLARARAPAPLGWEDYELLRTLGRQAASYLAEQRAIRALEEAREFDIFNRRFAFVLHDIKNLVSQLSLGARNLEQYGDNAAFRADLAKSVRDAVARMKRLIDRLDSTQVASNASGVVRLGPLIENLVAAKRNAAVAPVFECRAPEAAVIADRDRFAAVLDHLIQNALEAVGGDGGVRVSLRREEGRAIIEVADDGPGMTPEFVRDELFKPFRSTKDGGLGIGVFQCRECVREMGGRLDAVSAPGKGTTMRITLPLAAGGAEDVPTLAKAR